MYVRSTGFWSGNTSWRPFMILPPRASSTVVRITGTLKALANLASPITLLTIIVGSWLWRFANWNGWWSIRTTTHSSGVSKAESPVNSDFADRLSGTLVCAGIGASLPREGLPCATTRLEVAGTAIAPAANPRNWRRWFDIAAFLHEWRRLADTIPVQWSPGQIEKWNAYLSWIE